MHGWMDGWMVGWMDGWRGGWRDGRMCSSRAMLDSFWTISSFLDHLGHLGSQGNLAYVAILAPKAALPLGGGGICGG